MKVREGIVKVLEREGRGLTAEQICRLGGFSGRTVVSRELRGLVEMGKVVVTRQGRNVYYTLSDGGKAINRDLDLWLTHEDEIWAELAQNESLRMYASENACGAVQFAFTEMLNNAIDHSKSRKGHVELTVTREKINFTVRDFGVGVFQQVMQTKGLESEEEAIREIMKGKTTTMPTMHSGEGIFWVSKMADRFELGSYGYRLIVDNIVRDYTIQKLDLEITGTEVKFEIDAQTPVSLEEFFGNYIGEREYAELDFTVVQLGLYREGSMWISRSQAKRVLRGLEKYRRVEFDFAGINMVGQAFCDEVFRVFKEAHPEVALEVKNANESVRMMIEWVARRDVTDGVGDVTD